MMVTSATPQIFSINPGTSNNFIDGIKDPNQLADYSIKIYNTSINCTITIKQKHGADYSFTITSSAIIKIMRSNLQKIIFSDTNSYNIYVSQKFIEYDNADEYRLALNEQNIEFVA